ncbi:MAG: hypothetical protein PHY23_06635, partial [Oscillospiraceae bacterium]|nr:hypothetical protein [Oscillospiraceae bacterium]
LVHDEEKKNMGRRLLLRFEKRTLPVSRPQTRPSCCHRGVPLICFGLASKENGESLSLYSKILNPLGFYKISRDFLLFVNRPRIKRKLVCSL